MQLTFTEMHAPTVGLAIQVDRQLYTEQSDFQRIDVFECEEFGRFLTLDGYMMLTERDEFIYHEMMVHVPLAVLGETVRKVLVIGGATAAACVSCADIHTSSISTWSRSTSAWSRCAGNTCRPWRAVWTIRAYTSSIRTG